MIARRVLPANREKIINQLGPTDVVLDVGAWAQPFARADWVIDLMPYETRGLYGYDREASTERFSEETWVQLDICRHERWPFADNQFDFAICSHTLEDVRDPVWVCSELVRVARAGYIEVPARVEEQTFGIQGPWVGWGHHHWLIDIEPEGLQFVFKHHIVHGFESHHFPMGFCDELAPEERIQALWWEGDFDFEERIFTEPSELDRYLSEFVTAHGKRERKRERGLLRWLG